MKPPRTAGDAAAAAGPHPGSGERLVSFDDRTGLGALWQRVFVPAPLIVVGTREADGRYDLAPKHMAAPLGPEGWFGFVCTEAHATLRNARRERAFTVSFPRPDRALVAGLAAAPRAAAGGKPVVAALPTFPATRIDAPLLAGGYLFLECELDRVVEGFGEHALVAGRIVAAHVAADALREADRDDQELLLGSPLLVYLAPGRWARIGASFGFPYPEGFPH
jgi:flavin reductase (DIM6/NTAB) family NADH-FMN oxidoreductase RutF